MAEQCSHNSENVRIRLPKQLCLYIVIQYATTCSYISLSLSLPILLKEGLWHCMYMRNIKLAEIILVVAFPNI